MPKLCEYLSDILVLNLFSVLFSDVKDQLLNTESLTPPANSKRGGRGGKRGRGR